MSEADDPRPRARRPSAALQIFTFLWAFPAGVVVQERTVLFHTGSFVFSEYGLAYAPDGRRPTGHYFGRTTYRHLFGRWWTFEASD
jgi:hypothetical protein